MRVPGDPSMRRLAGQILLWQSLVSLGLAALVAAAVDGASGRSTLAGGLIGLIANLFMTLAALRPTHHAGLALGRLLVGQFVKVLLTVAMFVAVAQRKDVVWPALIAGYIATLLVFWAVPVLQGPRSPPRSRARP